MALDTLAAILRTMGAHALEQAGMEPAAFTAACEGWARHVSLGAAPPGGQAASDGRRDWQGLREFVRSYCQGSAQHARSVVGDLRQVVWAFIESLNQTLAHEREDDARVREKLARLEALAAGAATGPLRAEVLETVGVLSQVMETRRRRHSAQLEALSAQVKTLGAELDAARRDSETDALTGLYNRRAFELQLERSVQLHRAFGEPICLLLVDVDRFKAINDLHGHPIGDEVLRKVADAVVRVFLRKSDFVARYGGDEMAVILRNTTAETGMALADRLLRSGRALEITGPGGRVPVTFSCGVAAVGGGDDPRSWLERADRGLYSAKQAGRDRAVRGD